jgi:hypothetical protein
MRLILLFSVTCVCVSLSEHRSLLEWAKVYPGVDSKNLELECRHNGKPICCNNNMIKKPYNASASCITTKKYVPSPYELRHQEKAMELQRVENIEERRIKLLEYITSPTEVQAAITWLQRVKVRTSSRNVIVKETIADREFLSRFLITKTCNSSPHGTHKHVEWIEPLTLHGRHPFGMAHCTYPYNGKDSVGEFLERNNPAASGVMDHYRSIFNVDYILLQPGRLPKNNHRRRYMLDAGTSDFWSSLWWFTCAYAQVRSVEIL